MPRCGSAYSARFCGSWGIISSVTKVQIRFRLDRPLDDALMQRVADAHAIYGIDRVVPSPSLDELLVDYDATRLSPALVEARLRQLGLPVVPASAPAEAPGPAAGSGEAA